MDRCRADVSPRQSSVSHSREEASHLHLHLLLLLLLRNLLTRRPLKQEAQIPNRAVNGRGGKAEDAAAGGGLPAARAAEFLALDLDAPRGFLRGGIGFVRASS
ncbi:uncharacterized protein J3R85_003317 [Psidium guajava]|nr:uncharacterized protein J3R85_003317 [Psidium guajava]